MNTLKTTAMIFVFIANINNCLFSQSINSISLNNDILIIKSEGNAFLNSIITEADAKIIAINNAKQTALEQAGLFLESHTVVLNNQVTRDDIISYSASLIKVNLLNEERQLINNMFSYHITIEALIDINLLNQRILEIQKDNKLKLDIQLERQRIKQLEAKIAVLQMNSENSTKEDVKNIINELTASDWADKAYATKDISLQIEYYSRAISLNSNFVGAYSNRAMAYIHLKKYDLAIDDYTNAINLDPLNSSNYYNRGNSYFQIDKYELAIQDLTKAIDINPQLIDAYRIRGLSYQFLNIYNLSLNDFNRYIYEKPNDGKAYYVRGIINIKLFRENEAIDDFNNYLRLFGNKEGNAEQVRNWIIGLGQSPKY